MSNQPGHSTGTPSGVGQFVTGAACATVAIAIWAGWLVVMRLGVTTRLPAPDLTALRFATAGLVLLPIVLRRGFAIDRLGWSGFAAIVSGAGAPVPLVIGAAFQFAPVAHAGALEAARGATHAHEATTAPRPATITGGFPPIASETLPTHDPEPLWKHESASEGSFNILQYLRQIWSGRGDSNPRPQPWQGCALPLSYTRTGRGGSARGAPHLSLAGLLCKACVPAVRAASCARHAARAADP